MATMNISLPDQMKEWAKPNLFTIADHMSDKGYQTAPLKCYCYNCSDPYRRMTTFIVCPTCGNKRCPKATDHNLECTNSNEPGQKGSRYD